MQSRNGSTEQKQVKKQRGSVNLYRALRRLDQLDVIETRRGHLSGKQEREYTQLIAQVEVV
jgi:hypothetical protein